VNQIASPGGSNGFPINTGTYNGQKVALDSDLTRVYEIQCLIKGLSTAGAAGAVGGHSFETCLKLCNDNASTCQWGVIWNNSTAGPYLGSCQIATGYSTANPVQVNVGAAIGTSQRVARLLNTTTYPLINDAIYFQSKETAGNLGFCQGGNNNNYNFSFVALQYIDGSYSGDTNQVHQISCGQLAWFGSGGSNIDATTIATLYGLPYPSTPEDCARLCNYNFRANVAPRCQAWQMNNVGQCEMYSNRIAGNPASPTTNPTVTAAGIRIGGNTQTAVPAYKRDEFASYPVGRYQRRVEYGGAAALDIKPDYIVKGL
jgi:hypothetical protein